MGMRKEVYEALGGFSDMRYGEDIDFSIRIFAAYWFDLPIDVAEFEEKLGIGAESGDYRIIEKVLPYADEVYEYTSVYQLNELDYMYRQLSADMQEEYTALLTVYENLEALYICRNVITVYPDCKSMIAVSYTHLELCRESFNSIPFINADGYHSKTIAYSIWHIFRIEDIVVHTVINEDEQVFFAGNYQERINSPIITTGNELIKQQIADFSKQLNLEELYSYIFEVRESTEKMLERLSYDELKRKIPEERKGYLESLNVVNDNEKAIWLIDYWCNKDICELIQMPFSRHWIMHTEACLRIKNKIHS